MGERNHSSIIMVATPKGVVVVRQSSKPPPIYPKLPGGISEPGETPVQTAVRKLRCETGISLGPEDLRCIFDEDRGHYRFYLFRADLDFVPELVERGTQGEEPAIMTAREILDGEFLPSQKRILGPHLRALLQRK